MEGEGYKSTVMSRGGVREAGLSCSLSSRVRGVSSLVIVVVVGCAIELGSWRECALVGCARGFIIAVHAARIRASGEIEHAVVSYIVIFAPTREILLEVSGVLEH